MKTLYRKYWVFILLLFVLFFAMPFLFTAERKMFWDITLINLPWRHHLSESINNGYLPLWNPYINNGFPQMGHYETWYPISWLIAFCFKYNLKVLQYEYLFHLFIAGIGFYKCSSLFHKLDKVPRVTGAIAYMLCGLFLSQASHLGYIISGAWMTFVFYFLIKFLREQHWKDGLYLTLSYVFLMTGGYPGNTIIITYICLAILIVFLLKNYKQANIQEIKRILIRLSVLSFILVVTTSVVIYNVIDLQSEITRQNLDYRNNGFGAQTGSNTFQSYVSVISPSTTSVKSDFWGTSPMLNNVYYGFLLFILPIFYLVYGRKQKAYKTHLILFILGVFFLLTSVATQFPLHKILYYTVPGLNRFRFPSIYRIFFIFSMLLVSLQGIQLIINHQKLIKQFKIWLVGLLVIAVIVLTKSESISISKLITNFDDSIKSFNLSQMLFIDMVIVTFLVLTLILLIYLRRKHLATHLALIIAVDLIIHTWIITPKFISTNQAPKKIDNIINNIPPDFPLINQNYPIKENHLHFNHSPDLWLNKHAYNKYPCILGSSPYSTHTYHKAIKNGDNNVLSNYPFIAVFDNIISNQIDSNYYNSPCTKKVISTFSSPNEFQFIVNSSKNKYLVFNHNQYKYWQFYENDKKLNPILVNTNFLAVKLTSNQSLIDIKFEAKTTRILFIVSSISFCLLILFALILQFKPTIKE